MRFTKGFFFIPGMLLFLIGQSSLSFARHCGESRPCQCGDMIVSDYTLSSDLGPCEKRGLTVRSGVTLDCAEYAIRGSGENSKDFGVALQTGTSGATIKNCHISGFLRGIRLRQANKNKILHNTVHHNGNVSTRVGYGIDLAGAQDNIFQDNYIHHNADEGIHVGTGSHGNTFISNRVEDNSRENFYFLRSDRAVLQRNSTRGGGADSIFIKHSSFLRLENNIFRDKPVTFRGDAHDNVLIDNELVDTGVRFQSYEERGVSTRPSKNLISGGKITNAGECLDFSNTSDNLVKNVQLTNCGQSVIAQASGSRAENFLIGVPLPTQQVVLDGAAVVHVGRQISIFVQDSKGTPVAGAKVQGVDAQKKILFEAETAADGVTPPQDVIDYSLQGSTKVERTPILLQVSSGQKTTSLEMHVTNNSTVTVTLPDP
ncbi:MAG: right-handed parallel beta-helix repeat-containing protein [Candidatus Binatia bacterium]